MTVNKTQFQGQKRLPNDLRDMRHSLRALKTPQPLGADVLRVEPVLSTSQISPSSASTTIAAGSQATITITVTPALQTLTLWNFLPSVYVDVPLVDTNLYGGVSNSLTAGQKNLTREDWFDWAESSDTTNVRVFKCRIKNNDSSSHVYYLYWNAYIPTLGTSH